MKNIIKKNQVIIFTIALMLIVAGYMNYTANTESTLEAAKYMDTEKYAELGDAQLVSSNVETDNVIEETVVDNIENIEDSTSNIIETNSAIEEEKTDNVDNQYFTQSKLDRDNMYSQMIETYQKILSNSSISETQRNIAQQEIQNINNQKNAIMISENLIKNKGFEDVVIFVNDNSVNVIIKAEELKQEQIAQIQNIIQRELKTEVGDIHISNKK